MTEAPPFLAPEFEPRFETDSQKLSKIFELAGFYPKSRKEMDLASAVIDDQQDFGKKELRRAIRYAANSDVVLENIYSYERSNLPKHDSNHSHEVSWGKIGRVAFELHRDIVAERFVDSQSSREFKFKTDRKGPFSPKPHKTVRKLHAAPQELGRESFDQALELLTQHTQARKAFWEEQKRRVRERDVKS